MRDLDWLWKALTFSGTRREAYRDPDVRRYMNWVFLCVVSAFLLVVITVKFLGF